MSGDSDKLLSICTNLFAMEDHSFLIFNGTADIKDVDGKKIFETSIPSYLQGQTIAFNFGYLNEKQMSAGPFRIEYVLCNEFALYLNDLGSINPANGFSNLRVSSKLNKSFELFYVLDETLIKDSLLSLKTNDGKVERLIIVIPENELIPAINFSNKIISRILDSICFRKHIPLKICRIEIFQENSKYPLISYTTIPFTSNVDLDEEDIRMAFDIPNALVPFLRLFREAINSANPHYRLLCFYRVKEGLEEVQAENAKKLNERKINFERQPLRLPDNDIMHEFFPKLIGKKSNAFFDYVKKHYRIPIAHLSLDDYENMLLDPADAVIDHKIAIVNTVLVTVIWQMIEDEWRFIKTYKLTEDET